MYGSRRYVCERPIEKDIERIPHNLLRGTSSKFLEEVRHITDNLTVSSVVQGTDWTLAPQEDQSVATLETPDLVDTPDNDDHYIDD